MTGEPAGLRFNLPKPNGGAGWRPRPAAEPECFRRRQTSRIGKFPAILDHAGSRLPRLHSTSGPEDSMQFTEHDLRAAVSAGALEADRLGRLMEFLATRQTSPVPAVAGRAAPPPRVGLAHPLRCPGAPF